MAAPQALENGILDAVAAALALIGASPTNWRLTSTGGPGLPEITEGIPNDPLPVSDKARLYFQVPRSDARDERTTGPVHRWRVWVQVWATAPTQRTLHDVKADVVDALYSSEATVKGQFGDHFWVESWQYRDEAQNAGYASGLLTLYIDTDVQHRVTT